MKFLIIVSFISLVFLYPLHSEAKEPKPEKEKMKMSGEHSGHNHKKGKHDHSDQKASVKKLKNEKLLIKVNGMVCAFCAQGIKKQFNKREEVKETKVNLDKMEVLVNLNKGKSLPEETIKKLVTDAGFSYEGLKDE